MNRSHIVYLVSIVITAVTASAQTNYTGAYGGYPHCEACHANGAEDMEQFDHWHMTAHATAYDAYPFLQSDESCLPCHTTGWDLTIPNGGFDDFFYAGDTTGINAMRNVQCESCHGPTDYPHAASAVIDCSSEVCGQCHNQEHSAYYDEWTQSRHNHSASTEDLVCARCHEAQSAARWLSRGEIPSELPEDPIWEVTCPSCHSSHEDELLDFQLRQYPPERLCRACHTMEGAVVGQEPHSPQEEMLNGPGNGAYEWPGFEYNNSCHWMYLPEPCVMCHQWPEMYGNPDTLSTGHSLEPDILFCATPGCHMDQIPPDSSYNIQGVFEVIDSLAFVLDSLLNLADTTVAEYRQARFDYQFVMNDGSRGIHNYFYARDLLISSIQGIEPYLVAGPGADRNPSLQQFYLYPPSPNPFNPATTLSFNLALPGVVRLAVYNISGDLIEVVMQEQLNPGYHQVTFQADQLSSGVYFYRLQAGDFTRTGKLVLLK